MKEIWNGKLLFHKKRCERAVERKPVARGWELENLGRGQPASNHANRRITIA